MRIEVQSHDCTFSALFGELDIMNKLVYIIFLFPGATSITRQDTRADSTEYDNFPQAQTMANFPPAVHDLLNFDQLLSQEERDVRDKVRAYMVSFYHCLLTYF